MNIDVIATAQQVSKNSVKGKTTVIIDVLRATSTMVTALSNGAKEVIPVTSPNEAFNLKKQIDESVLLGGERNAEPIEGFDFGNSPLDYIPQAVHGKILVMTTTNGTLAIKNSLAADELLIGSFLNDMAIANYLLTKDDIVLVCSGNNGFFTLEDALCAGRIIFLLKQNNIVVELSDFALTIESLYLSNKGRIKEFASSGYHYSVLKKKGYDKDLEFCFRTGIYDLIPVWDGRALRTHNSR